MHSGDADAEQLSPETVKVFDFLRAICKAAREDEADGGHTDEEDADARNSLPSLTDVERIKFGLSATRDEALVTPITQQHELWTIAWVWEWSVPFLPPFGQFITPGRPARLTGRPQ